jgi:branched-chain amino acid transport system permease protein
VIGLAEAFSQGYVSTRFYDLFVFGILIVVLIVRPSGLLGKADIKKV